jgi:hypothetical protein
VLVLAGVYVASSAGAGASPRGVRLDD